MDILKEVSIKGTKISIIKGDLTESGADAIVNAANSYLRHGGGVAGAIVRKGGSVIQEESDTIGYVPVGECGITSGGKLKARYVIHAVGPRWGEGDEHNKLRSAIRNVLALATSRGFGSIAMPAISAGIFGFPKAECAQIIIGEIVSFLKGNTSTLKEIALYLFDQEIIGFFIKEIKHVESDTS
jgi:O-acetyl-ADP-ribose deacetylase (regulator of RNase III)